MRAIRRLIMFSLGVALAAGLPVVSTSASLAAEGTPGSVMTWGGNSFGELGNGTTTGRLTPGPVVGLDDAVSLHGGREHVIALRSNGTVVTWGSNAKGQLGVGGTANRSTPTQVPGLSGITAVTTGHYHALALASDGTVWAWGMNSLGQLGDGTKTLRRTPVKVSGLAGITAIAAGRDMSYAVRSDGTVWAWGLNSDGQLGDGTLTQRLTPVRVGSLDDIVAVAGGRDHGLAVSDDGTVWAWGWNAYGQLGDGTLTDRTNPVQVTTGVAAVTAGAHHSYALGSDGTVLSWGRNYRNALGDDTRTQRTRPVQVLDVAGAVAIASGRDHGIAILGDGAVKTWGNNPQGQLGDGTTTSRDRAVLIDGVENAQAAGGGAEYTVVLVADDGPPPPNQDPVARITMSCNQLTCAFGGGTSTDADGTVVSHQWTFGDGDSADGPSQAHEYANPGTYPVTLTVTDDDEAVDTATANAVVDVTPAGDIVFRSAVTSNTNTRSPSVMLPADVQSGDVLLMFAATNRDTTMSTPFGWTLLDTGSSGTDVRSWLFTRAAPAGLGGARVQVTLGARSKTQLTALAYTGAGIPSTVASAAATATSAFHASPSVPVGAAGSQVVGYWVDKTGGHSGWDAAASITERATSSGSGGGQLTSMAGDSGPVPAGTWPGATATSGASTRKALAWSVVLPPA